MEAPAWVNLGFFTILFVVLSDCQTTPFDEFGGVAVPDKIPTIASSTEKRYTTTIRLEKISQGVEFIPDSFGDAAEEFYSTVLSGFINVENVQSSTISSSIIQATYDAVYSYQVLTDFVLGDDNAIQNAIGNVNSVRDGLNSVGDILRFYSVVDDEETFLFDGSSLCASANCNGTYVTCVETTDGISANCVSECKNGYCGGDGICFHTDPYVAPTCRCTSLNDLWIIGARCETKIPLWLVVLLSVIGFIIIFGVVVIVVICVTRKRREKKRKQDLLNSVPTSYENRAFANDQIRTITTVPPQSNRANTLTREDSFETVTSSEYPPSEYRPRSYAGRRSQATSIHTSRGHHRNEHHHHQRHRHHRRRSSDDSRRRSGNRRSRERSSEAVEVQREPPESEPSSSDIESDLKDFKNLSFYEVEVNDLDLETDAASSIVASSSIKSSPIRWLPPKNDQPRPGWVPSLGPMMYDLPSSKNGNKAESLPRRREGGTNV